MNRIAKTIAVLTIGAFALTGCDEVTDYEKRKDQQKETSIQGETLEQANLKEKMHRENDPDAIRYMYLFVPGEGQPIGYYVLKGKVSSSGSQLGPELEIMRAPDGSRHVVDSAQDDKTFGTGDPGVFFFLANGTMADTNLLYISSDEPLPFDVPLLGEVATE